MANSRDVIIVVSTPRSGTTWLGNILQAHSRLHARKDDTAVLYLLHATRMLNPFTDDIKHTPTPRNIASKIRANAVIAYYGATPPQNKLALVSPTYAGFLPLLIQAYPDAKYVHLQRCALDAIASFRRFLDSRTSAAQRYRAIKKWGHLTAFRAVLAHLFHTWRWARFHHQGYLGLRPEGFQEVRHLPLLEFLCWYYVSVEHTILQALAEVPESQKYDLTYENLAMDYGEEIRELLKFIEVEIRDDYLSKTSNWIRTDAIGRYQRAFSQQELALIRRSLTHWARHFSQASESEEVYQVRETPCLKHRRQLRQNVASEDPGGR